MRGDVRDADDLTWYFLEGLTAFERSNMGPVIAAIENSAYISRKCVICDNGILTELKIRNAHRGTYPEVSRRKPGDWCPVCGGVGYSTERMSDDEASLADSGCRQMSGGESRRYQVPDEVLVRYAYVSRALCRIPRVMAKALGYCYGPEGEEQRLTHRGRAWACVHLTRSGKAVLKQERARGDLKRREPPERQLWCLTELADTSGKTGDKDTAKLLSDAAEEAKVLLLAAERYWLWAISEETKTR